MTLLSLRSCQKRSAATWLVNNLNVCAVLNSYSTTQSVILSYLMRKLRVCYCSCWDCFIRFKQRAIVGQGLAETYCSSSFQDECKQQKAKNGAKDYRYSYPCKVITFFAAAAGWRHRYLGLCLMTFRTQTIIKGWVPNMYLFIYYKHTEKAGNKFSFSS